MKVDAIHNNPPAPGQRGLGPTWRKRTHGIAAAAIAVLLIICPLAPAQEDKPAPPPKEPETKQPAKPPAKAPANPPAQPPAKPGDAAEPGPAPAAEAEAALKGVIRDAKGLVQLRKAADQPWQWAKKGMALEEGYQLRTSARSRVAIFFPPDENFLLDRLGTLTILRAQKSGVKVSIDLGMKYGRTRARIEAGGLEHETKIHAPSGTLAIRGSDGEIVHDAFRSYMAGEGRFERLDRRKRTTHIFGRSGVVATVQGDRPAAGVEQGEATVDAKGAFAGRVVAEGSRTEGEPGTAGEDYREIFELQREDSFSFAAGALTVPPPDTFIIALANLTPPGTAEPSITIPGGFTVSAGSPLSPDGIWSYAAGGGGPTITGTRFTPGAYTISVDHTSGPFPSLSALLLTQSTGGGPLLPINPAAPSPPVPPAIPLNMVFPNNFTTNVNLPVP